MQAGDYDSEETGTEESGPDSEAEAEDQEVPEPLPAENHSSGSSSADQGTVDTITDS